MANIISKGLGYINTPLTDVQHEISGVTTGYVNKAWRAAILVNRAKHVPAQFDTKDPAKGSDFSVKEFDAEYIKRAAIYTHNSIIIYNLNSSPYEYIEIQNRPDKVEYRGETSWASIKSMGRNTPMYHYTGAEDIIQINVSWYCDDKDNPKEVINKCRLLETWTKSDGYVKAPPVLRIQWGRADIFADQNFILTSATYTLSNFRDLYKKDGELIDGKLYPMVATQELIFKRVSATNLRWNDIISVQDRFRTVKKMS
jgi:hypothetical protein